MDGPLRSWLFSLLCAVGAAVMAVPQASTTTPIWMIVLFSMGGTMICVGFALLIWNFRITIVNQEFAANHWLRQFFRI